LFLHWSPFASLRVYEGLLHFTLPTDLSSGQEKMSDVMKQYCSSIVLVAMREATQGERIEYSYQIRLLDPTYQVDLLDAVIHTEHVGDAHLLMHRATVEI